MDTLCHYVRGMQRSQIVKGIPIEAERSACDPDAISADFKTLGQLLCDFLACLVMNLDEISRNE
jgi:hypothetical protein